MGALVIQLHGEVSIFFKQARGCWAWRRTDDNLLHRGQWLTPAQASFPELLGLSVFPSDRLPSISQSSPVGVDSPVMNSRTAGGL